MPMTASFKTFTGNNAIRAEKMQAQGLEHIGFGNYKKTGDFANSQNPTYVWDFQKQEFVTKGKEHTKLIPNAVKSSLGWRGFADFHDPLFLYSKRVGNMHFPTRDEAIAHVKKEIETHGEKLLGESLQESSVNRDMRAKAKGLTYNGWGYWSDTKGMKYLWVEQKNDFEPITKIARSSTNQHVPATLLNDYASAKRDFIHTRQELDDVNAKRGEFVPEARDLDNEQEVQAFLDKTTEFEKKFGYLEKLNKQSVAQNKLVDTYLAIFEKIYPSRSHEIAPLKERSPLSLVYRRKVLDLALKSDFVNEDEYNDEFGSYLEESDDVKSAKAKAMGLKHIAYNLYKKDEEAYEWDKTKNDFVKLEEKHPYDLTPKSKHETIHDALKFVNKHPGEWHGVSRDKKTRDAVKALEKEGHVELKIVNPGATHEAWFFKSK